MYPFQYNNVKKEVIIMKGFLFKLMALMAIISLIVMPVYADHSADNDVLGTDDEKDEDKD